MFLLKYAHMTEEPCTESEVLGKYELIDITRRFQSRHQIEWLKSNGWQFEIVRKAPVVRREYARARLAEMRATVPQN